ncbi:MAG: O-antigen ligase family protein [Syntrophaceae bacterium]|jgi:O-antigen ligase|nr:O-antigen ligase family protein [Syntrophaceae bacterium]HQI97777.1 O-antigen ligase family protein [Syntrophorhabdus sp.]
MIAFIYIFFIFLLSVHYLNFSGPLSPVFDLLGVPVGTRTFVVEGLMLIVCLAIFATSKCKAIITKQVCKLGLAWMPFILYMIARCDFTAPYALKKLALMVIAQFLTLLFLCVAYINDPVRFNKQFFPLTILYALLLYGYSLVNPSVEVYNLWTNPVERVTIEKTNPIWLARSFATGSLCFLLLQNSPKWSSYAGLLLFIPGILLTGSRGPLISLFLIASLWGMYRWFKSGKTLIVGTVLICAIIPITIIVFVQYQEALDRYFHRGTQKSMLLESGRLQGVMTALEEFSFAPMLGRGLGKYGTVAGIERKYITPQKVVAVYPHNVPVEILAELGLIGFVLFLIALRPGKWMFDLSNRYVYFFFLSFLFSLTSGDMTANSGLFIFSLISKLASEPSEH